MDTDIILEPSDQQKLVSIKNPISMDDISVQQPRRRRFPTKKRANTATKPILSTVNRTYRKKSLPTSGLQVGAQQTYESPSSASSDAEPESETSASDVDSLSGAAGGGGVNLDLLSNPTKKLSVPNHNSDDNSSDSGSQATSNSDDAAAAAVHRFAGGATPEPNWGGQQQSDYQGQSYEPQQMSEEAYRNMQNQKHEYLYKLYRLEQKGIKYNRKLTMKSSLDELRSEYDKVVRDIEVESSIKFQRRVLMACVSTLEYTNNRFDPFDLKLEGWSESVMDDVDNYDGVFERMHDKYKTRAQMAPEVELLMSLAGSAFMFHLTNSLFKSAMPNMSDIMKQNPELMQNISQAMANNAKANNHVTPQQAPPDRGTSSGSPHGANPLSSMMNNMFTNMKDPEEEERLDRVGSTHKNFANSVGSLPMPRPGGDRFEDLGSVASSEAGSDSDFDVKHVSYPVSNKKGKNEVTLKL